MERAIAVKTMRASALALLASLPAPVRSAPAPSVVEVVVSTGAQKLLDAHGMTLDGGLLRRLEEKDGTDLAAGGLAVRAVVHPKDKAALAVASYRQGQVDVVLTIGFNKTDTVISPFSEPDDVIALLFPSVTSKGPEPGRTCYQTKSSGQLREFAGDDFVSSPCAGREAGCDPQAVWAALRRLYIRELSSVPGDEVGRAAADFLRTSSVTLRAVSMSLIDSGRSAGYVPQTNSIELPLEHFTPLWSLLKGSELPPEAVRVVAATARDMVHEVSHARMMQTLGFLHPDFFEDEVLAHTDESLFLWARLEGEPDYRGTQAFDRVMMSIAGSPETLSPWWQQPLDYDELPRLRELRGEAKAKTGAALQPGTVNDWFSARALAGGIDNLSKNVRFMREDGSTPSAVALWPGFFEEKAASVKKRLATLEYCREQATKPADRKHFEVLIAGLAEELSFFGNPSRIARLMEYYKAERAAQQAILTRRLKR